MNEKLEALHSAVSALCDTVQQLRQENATLKNGAAQLSAQYRQLRQQHAEETAQFWARHEESQKILHETAERLRTALAALPENTNQGAAS
ncbi:MAG: hypothetical protein Q4G42_06180 [Neisseria sp.]|nr:hypothetical protein [Neisseria sp.]